jgi:hypothetical protein
LIAEVAITAAATPLDFETAQVDQSSGYAKKARTAQSGPFVLSGCQANAGADGLCYLSTEKVRVVVCVVLPLVPVMVIG